MSDILGYIYISFVCLFILAFAGAVIYGWVCPPEFEKNFSNCPNWDERVEVEENE